MYRKSLYSSYYTFKYKSTYRCFQFRKKSIYLSMAMLEQDSDDMWYQITRSLYFSSYFITSKDTRMFLYKSYVSAGSSNHYKYGQVAAILSLLLTTSTLVLLLITVCDVGKGEENHFKQVRVLFPSVIRLKMSLSHSLTNNWMRRTRLVQ